MYIPSKMVTSSAAVLQLKEDLAGQEAEDEGREEEEEHQEETCTLRTNTQEDTRSTWVKHTHTPTIGCCSVDLRCCSAVGGASRSSPEKDQSQACRR